VVQLHRKIDDIHAAGAEVHVIGNGTPSFIAGFREETGWKGPVYTDPSLAVYKAAELERGVGKTLDPRSLGGALRAFAHGQRQGRTQGDAWQQGGTLVVATDGRVRFHHISGRPDDVSAPDQILAALR
jgi:alkyl-hydroperoxide reductase/thiol specific antioxidant family protein